MRSDFVMDTATALTNQPQFRLYQRAFALAVFTIVYNLLEGFLSTYFGYQDESLTLFGFGIDSFIEVVSGIGVAHMTWRMRQRPDSNRDAFERNALRTTGFAFYALVAGLLSTTAYNVWTGHQPETTVWGFIISLVSIAVMWALVVGKTAVGRRLHSKAIIADAQCTNVCLYMSFILLASSGLYELTNLPHIDTIGTLGLAYFAFREGQEGFEKARSNKQCSCHSC